MNFEHADADRARWPRHLVKAGAHSYGCNESQIGGDHREHIEPWLASLFQAEHLNLLVGNGFTTAISTIAASEPISMNAADVQSELAVSVSAAIQQEAARSGRSSPNLEDQIRVINELISGLEILAKSKASIVLGPSENFDASALESKWRHELNKLMKGFVRNVLCAERNLVLALGESDGDPHSRSRRVRNSLAGFLLPFASRMASRDRLHVFTTNYDRLIEFSCDLMGIRILDHFIGHLAPTYASSKLELDYHFNPPGISGEPRRIEGVIRFAKLHGSIDWKSMRGPAGSVGVRRYSLPFGAAADFPEIPPKMSERLLIFPNPAKDAETLEYPYADMFRDFISAVCRPNAVVVTYGYGFGDDHINRVLKEMLNIPSTHLVIISFDYARGQLKRFIDQISKQAQLTLLIGPHFADLETLIDKYLPKPAIDRTTVKMMDLLRRRVRPSEVSSELAIDGDSN